MKTRKKKYRGPRRNAQKLERIVKIRNVCARHKQKKIHFAYPDLPPLRTLCVCVTQCYVVDNTTRRQTLSQHDHSIGEESQRGIIKHNIGQGRRETE